MTVSTLPRARSFRDDIEATIRESEAADLALNLFDLHEREMQPLRQKARTLAAEATAAHEEHRRSFHMLGQAEALAANVTQQVSRHAAVLSQQAELLGKVRKLAQMSFDGNVKAEDLAVLLTTEIIKPTLHQIPLAFMPSEQFRAGVFTSHDRAVSVTLTFVGWTAVAKYVGGGIAVEPTFLVSDRGALPASTIEVERDLHLQMPLLPPLSAVA